MPSVTTILTVYTPTSSAVGVPDKVVAGHGKAPKDKKESTSFPDESYTVNAYVRSSPSASEASTP